MQKAHSKIKIAADIKSKSPISICSNVHVSKTPRGARKTCKPAYRNRNIAEFVC